MKWVIANVIRVVGCAVVGLFCLMVTSLLCFHSYLALTNQTTCKGYPGESMSWEKISYLKAWPSELGSPFTIGWRGNLKIYCCEKLPPGPREWTMPTHLPSSPTHI